MTNAHPSFPLTSLALQRSSLSPDYPYREPTKARIISDRLCPSGDPLSPADFSAIGLIGYLSLSVIDKHLHQVKPDLFSSLDVYLKAHLNPQRLSDNLKSFLSTYPTAQSFSSPDKPAADVNQILKDSTERQALLKSLFLILAAESNPQIRGAEDIFFDSHFFNSPAFSEISTNIRRFFEDPGCKTISGKSILSFLESPAKFHPSSLADQLYYIYLHWGEYLDHHTQDIILSTLDLIREESTPRLMGPGPIQNPLGSFSTDTNQEDDLARFSPDLDWMSTLVLIAKNIYVWLDQLSKKYSRNISRLDLIPDAELAQLADWGISGLWLIGIWERSPASQKIKKHTGNPDAISSAYSLYNYTIASSLGGEDAFQDLKARAHDFSIHLAGDMVPNHVGLYSDWIINHPERFISLDHSPFPAYSFTGPNLSDDPDIGLYIEDHYFNQQDAAVVFKRVDFNTGIEMFIYHGNDGTSMPWNDTAQLDFLQPQTREAVLQEILSVAQKFSIIRFDAAMTLTKKHFQRLWYPTPGTGGAIPTRSDHGLSQNEFNQRYPIEFWREVVERITEESPDTLLLAEAFWMMEGYFVRSLGMHRVYNSAFMHMLRDEDNQKFKSLILETLEYDPQILKRYVNFMNNPDEDTAISQFGTDGKYFGVCTLMATLPGLPMIGHGQIEGFTEKYGMEYRRAYYDEEPDHTLIERHAREIFPLFKLRRQFASVDHFYLYDVKSKSGSTLSDVIAYSNYSGSAKSLVIYHNAWGDVDGNLHFTAKVKNQSFSLIDALNLDGNDEDFVLFKEHISGLEYIRSIQDLYRNGLKINLGAYDYRVYLDFKIIKDPAGLYQELEKELQGKGVKNIQLKIVEIKFKDHISSLLELTSYTLDLISQIEADSIRRAKNSTNSLLSKLRQIIPLLSIPQNDVFNSSKIRDYLPALYSIADYFDLPDATFICSLLIALNIKSNSNLERDDLINLISNKLDSDLPAKDRGFKKYIPIILVLLDNISELSPNSISYTDFWFSNPLTSSFLSINEFEGVNWFNQESLERMINMTMVCQLIFSSKMIPADQPKIATLLDNLVVLRDKLLALIGESNCQVESYITLANQAANGLEK